MSFRVKLLSLFSVVLLNMACMKEERDVVRQVEIIVSSKFVSCRPSFTSTISDSCLMVTFVGQDASSPWPNKTIAGFYYEQGSEYRILVKATKLANPPMDSGDTEYELIKVISKTKVN